MTLAERITLFAQELAAWVKKLRTENIGVTFDGGGSALTAGKKVYRVVDFACDIKGWTILSDVSGSAVVDVKKCTYANFATTASIAGSEKPALSSAIKNQDMDLATWTDLGAVSAGDILEFNLESCSTVTMVQVFLKVEKV